MNRFVILAVTLVGANIALSAVGTAVMAQESRYVMQRAEGGFVRLDTQTGEMSLCQQQDEQIVCRLAADERRALEEEIALLEERVAKLEGSLSETEGGALRDRLPSDDEIDRTLGVMENMMRRFLGVIEEFENDMKDDQPGEAKPEKTNKKYSNG
jgi:hypothetical protein